MMNNLVSIIIPVYNAEKYLPKCIESVLSQTYKTFELILINDGSSDNSAEICATYAEKDSRIKPIHQKNAGVSAARNRGISEANGEYICFIDADDWIEKDYLDHFISNIELSYSDFIISGYTYDYEKSGKVIKYDPPKKNAQLYEDIKILIPSLIDNKMLKSVWSKLFKLSIIKKYKIHFDTTISYSEDVVFCWTYLFHINSINTIPNAGYHYRNEEAGSLTTKKYPYEIWDKIANSVLNANLLVINKYELNSNEKIAKRIYEYYTAMKFTANLSMYDKYFLKNRQLRLEKWNEIRKDEYFYIRKVDSHFIKAIKFLVLYGNIRLTDSLLKLKYRLL